MITHISYTVICLGFDTVAISCRIKMTTAMSAKDIEKKMGKRKPCTGRRTYEIDLQTSSATGAEDVCYATFSSTADEGTIWEGFPKVSIARNYCDDGSPTCKNKKTSSDIYEIFDLVDFGYEDYTKQDATMAAKLIAKIDSCSDSKLSEKKRAMWGEFLTTTIGGVGQKTNTSTIMGAVGDIAKSGTSVTGGLSSLGSVATQFLAK